MSKEAYRYRLYPNNAQRRKFGYHFGCCRYVWNSCLASRKSQYKKTGKSVTYSKMSKKLTEVKKKLPWLMKVKAQSLQQTLKDLDCAYQNFFAKLSRFPRFKSRKGIQSFRVPQSFKVENGKLKLPKISLIKIVLHRQLPTVIKNVTIIRETDGRYYASFCCEVEDPKPIYEGGFTGLDLGLKDFFVDDEGNRIPNHLEKSLKKLRRLQRKHSRRKKGSNRREKARLAIARQHSKVRHQRQDFLHTSELGLDKVLKAVRRYEETENHAQGLRELLDELKDLTFFIVHHLRFRDKGLSNDLLS